MLIVDTYNVLHTTGVLPPRLAAPGVPGLVRLLASSRYAHRRITLVCDGGSDRQSGYRMGNIHILYAGPAREADDVIEHLIRRYARGNVLEVVSSDRRLQRAARRHRAGSISSESFLEHLVHDERLPPPRRGNVLRKQVPLDAYSVAQWLREFGYEPSPTRPEGGAGPAEPRSPSVPPGAPPSPSPPADRGPSPASGTIGERLHIDWSPPQQPGSRRPADEPRAPTPADEEPIDPLLLEALQEWRDRLSIDDLDMKRWLPDE